MQPPNPNQQLKHAALTDLINKHINIGKTPNKMSNITQQPFRKQQTNLLLAFAAIPLLFLVGCQSAPLSQKTSAPVIPRENAVFDTYGLGKTKTAAISDAMNNANITCGKEDSKSVIVTKDTVKYNGIVNEETGHMIDKASKVIGILAGQSLPEASSEDDYEAQITFKCV